MITVFKIEMKKILKGKLFWFVIIFAIVLTVVSAVKIIQVRNQNFESAIKYNLNLLYAIYDNAFVNTVYRDFENITPAMFYRFIPLISVLAYGWSYSSDVRSGYIKSIITRTSKLKYLTSKYFATFISGGLVVLIPVLVNILTLACFMPFRMPNVAESINYTELPAFAFANLFYEAPPIIYDYYSFISFYTGWSVCYICYGSFHVHYKQIYCNAFSFCVFLYVLLFMYNIKSFFLWRNGSSLSNK